MKNLSFSQLAITGLLLSGLGYISFELLNLIFFKTDALQLAIALCGLVYLGYLFSKSPKKVGKVTGILTYICVCLLSLYVTVPTTLFAITIASSLWFIRCFLFHRTSIAIISDACLMFVGLAAAYWSIIETSSLFLGFWSYFLIQALLPFLPQKIKSSTAANPAEENNRFEAAHRNAEIAISRISNLHS